MDVVVVLCDVCGAGNDNLDDIVECSVCGYHECPDCLKTCANVVEEEGTIIPDPCVPCKGEVRKTGLSWALCLDCRTKVARHFRQGSA